MLLDILANKTGIQFLAGWEAFFSPEILKQQSDSFWETHMRNIATQPFPGMVLAAFAATYTHCMQAGPQCVGRYLELVKRHHVCTLLQICSRT